jgi:putative lipoic acid-binding regulatory protein
MTNNGGNGGCGDEGKSCRLFGGEKVNYPVSFDLKMIIVSTIDPAESIANMETLLNRFNIPFSDWRTRPSSGGKYISYTVKVEIRSQQLLDDLYRDIKKLPGLKFAI